VAEGTGSEPVADWWLAKTRELDDESEAAAAPAKTTDRAKIRMASFIVGYLSEFRIDRMKLNLHA
jgi:hypothetical protein